MERLSSSVRKHSQCLVGLCKVLLCTSMTSMIDCTSMVDCTSSIHHCSHNSIGVCTTTLDGCTATINGRTACLCGARAGRGGLEIRKRPPKQGQDPKQDTDLQRKAAKGGSSDSRPAASAQNPQVMRGVACCCLLLSLKTWMRPRIWRVWNPFGELRYFARSITF